LKIRQKINVVYFLLDLLEVTDVNLEGKISRFNIPVTILDINRRPVLYIKHDVSVKRNLLRWADTALITC
jgi:hypothetical protein